MKHLSILTVCFLAFIYQECSVYAAGKTIGVANAKQSLYGYSQVMVQQNIIPDVYRGTLWKIDNEVNAAPPKNFRIADNKFINIKNKEDNYLPSLQGLTDTKMSGSGEFNASQLPGLKDAISKYHNGKIYIVDLRQESHLFVNNRSLTWYGLRDWGNVGKNLLAVNAAEKQLSSLIRGKVIDIYSLDADKQPCKQELIVASDVKTEKDVVAKYGFDYYRIPCTDHVCLTTTEVDEFVTFVKSLDANVWLHFHCAAGVGRTTYFMALYDMMRNPKVALKDIVYRQYLLGGNYLLKTSSHGWRDIYYKEKAANIELLYQYVQANYKTNYAESFYEWSINKLN